MRRAASPETTAAAIEVPPILKYWPSVRHVSHIFEKADPRGIVEARCAPGATTSGLRKPSCVRPWLDHEVRKSSVIAGVPPSSTAPTVITKGSLAGAKSTP